MFELLIGGSVCLLDEADAHLSAHKWGTQRGRNTRYVFRFDGARKVFMHRLIAGASRGDVVDHINGNGLDNRRGNLRLCSVSLNNANCPPRSGRRYKGVYKLAGKRYGLMARIGKEYLGLFKTEREAALAYNEAAVKKYGDFARLNEVDAP